MEGTFDGQSALQVIGGVCSTSMSHLNDDCLRECFEHLRLHELIAVADVCSRFKQIAQAHFRTTVYRYLEGSMLNFLHKNYGMLEISKLLRNFGASVVSIDVRQSHFVIHTGAERRRISEIERAIIELVCRHCGGSLEEFKCFLSGITIDLAQMIHLLIPRLKRLHLTDRGSFGLFANTSPETNILKLEVLTLFGREMRTAHIEKLLAKAPHLRTIEIDVRVLDRDFFQSIGQHLPLIETIQFQHSSEIATPIYLGNLSKLKTLEITSFSKFQVVFNEIATSDASLEHLRLISLKVAEHPTSFLFGANTSRLKNLRSLILNRIPNLRAYHLIDIVKNLGKLIEFGLYNSLELTKENIFRLIQNAKALQNFYYYCDEFIRAKMTIDNNDFKKMVNIVEERHKNTHLRIALGELNCTTNVSVDLAKANGDSMTLSAFCRVATRVYFHTT